MRRQRPPGIPPRPSVAADFLHFLGEVEVIFGLWGIPLVVAIVVSHGWTTAAHYLNDTVNYTEPMFVVVIMALASTRPIVELAEGHFVDWPASAGALPPPGGSRFSRSVRFSDRSSRSLQR